MPAFPASVSVLANMATAVLLWKPDVNLLAGDG